MLFVRSHGDSPDIIAKHLKGEGLYESRKGLAKFFQCYDVTGSLATFQADPDPVLQIVEDQMQQDEETTVVQLMALLTAHYH